MPRNPKVYVVQEPLHRDGSGRVVPRFSMTKAEAFGTITYLLNWSDTKDLNARQMLWKIRRGLTGYDSRVDFLLMTGSPTGMALAAVAAHEIGDGCMRVLYWDNISKQYRVEELDFHAQPV